MINPLKQFMIKPIIPINIGGFDLSFTNSSLLMILVTASIIIFQLVGVRKHLLIPSRFQSMVEVLYEFVLDMVESNVGAAGRAYFPFIFSIFTFVLCGNLFGMMPFSFTFTSHIIVTFSLAIVIFLMATTMGIAKHKLHFFKRFLPAGVPLAMAPLILPVEVLSYFFRPISLSVRLFANMLAGHIVLKLFISFTIMLGFLKVFPVVFGVFPFLMNIVFTGFEFFIASLQAYIFTILTCAYMNDALQSH